MSGLFRRILIICMLLILGYVGWRTYLYFFDQSAPRINVSGVCQGGYYCGDVLCSIHVCDDYKVDTLRVLLDGQRILDLPHARARSLTQNIRLQTTRMHDGQHVLLMNATDGARTVHQSQQEILFHVDNAPLQASLARPEAEFKVLSGHVLYVPVQVNKQVKRVCVQAFSKEFRAIPASAQATLYECFIPVDCDEAPGELPLKISVEDGVGHSWAVHSKFQIMPTTFKKQTLRLVDLAQFEQEHRLGKSEKELRDFMLEATRCSPAEKMWRGPFFVPINKLAVTCEFGTRRISQERGCYTHAALDLIGMPHAMVWAPHDGIVVLKDRFAITGNTVVIDHGCGVLSLLCHLDKFADIAVGDKIRRGNPIGVTGKTGYATGDHLHWEMRVGNVCVDPMQWTNPYW